MRKGFIFLFISGIVLLSVLSGSEQEGQALVRVRAVTDGNTPVPSVTVSLSERDWNTHEERVFSGKTSAEGECSISIPILRRYTSLRISVNPPSGCRFVPHMLMPSMSGRGSSIRIDPGERKDLTVLFLQADTSLSGKITDSEGKSITGARILLEKGRWFSQTAVTDAKGIYRFPKLAAGSYVIRRINVPEKSLLIPLYSYKPWGVTSVELQEKKPAEKDFVLSFGASIRGRVLGPEGKPLKGAKISCGTDAATDVGKKSMYQKPGESFSASCVTDARGSYMLGGLTTETYVVRVKPPQDTDYGPAAVRGISVKGTDKITLRDISLYNGGMIRCRITDHTGRPAAGARVTLFRPAEHTRMMRISTGKVAAYTAGPQGTVEFKGLNTNIYTLKVVPSLDSEACEAAFSDIRIISGLCITQTFSLPQGLAVQGTVTDPEGNPVKGARVRVNYYSDKQVITDARGSYRMYGLPLPADHYARRRRFKPSLTIKPPDEQYLLLTATRVMKNMGLGKTLSVDAVLKKGYAVAGTVTGPDGKPVPGCTVRLVKRIRHGISGYGSAVTDDRGVYFLGHMNMQKKIRVECTPPQDTGLLFNSILKGSFPAGQTANVNISLKQGGRITGSAVTSEGRLLPGVTVRARSLDKKKRSRIRPVFGNRNNNAVTGPKGTFSLSGLYPGAYKLEFTSSISGYRALPVEVDVAASGESTVKAVFERSGTLSGTLKDGNGKPFGYRKARILLELNGNAVKRTGYPDKNGHFSISGLFPGRYTIKTVIYRKAKNKRHREPAVSRQVVIKPGKAANLDIVMSDMETETIF